MRGARIQVMNVSLIRIPVKVGARYSNFTWNPQFFLSYESCYVQQYYQYFLRYMNINNICKWNIMTAKKLVLLFSGIYIMQFNQPPPHPPLRYVLLPTQFTFESFFLTKKDPIIRQFSPYSMQFSPLLIIPFFNFFPATNYTPLYNIKVILATSSKYAIYYQQLQ